jgi:glycosyltransferase involved in cell wall biosynthesis
MAQEISTADHGAASVCSATTVHGNTANSASACGAFFGPSSEPAPPVTPHALRLDGVNVVGYLTAESGVGEAARGYVRALQQAGIAVALNNFDAAVGSRKQDQSFSGFAQNNPYSINLICINADQIPVFVETVGQEYFRDRYNIGVWWWELPDFPQEYWSSFRWFDEIWVGSSFIQQSLSKYSPVPIVRIPPAVSIPTDILANLCRDKLSQRQALALPDKDFIFLFMFDFFSGFERKNPLATIRAFKQAFEPSEPVRLVMKCINSQKSAKKLQQLQEAIGDARITILDRYLSGQETTGLIAACDAYVSLHRSEGLGLPLVEAMRLEKPVIATGWSGNADFMTVSNSYPLPYKLVVNDADVGPYRTGELWAQPDETAAAQNMRQVYHAGDDAEISLKLRNASADAESQFSEQSVAALINGRLRAIRCFNPDRFSTTYRPYFLDATVEKQLEIIANGGAVSGGTDAAKSFVRKLFMPIVERAGYLNSIYLQLFRRLFTQAASTTAQLDLIDSRTRNLMANVDARMRVLEKEITELKSLAPSTTEKLTSQTE